MLGSGTLSQGSGTLSQGSETLAGGSLGQGPEVSVFRDPGIRVQRPYRRVQGPWLEDPSCRDPRYLLLRIRRSGFCLEAGGNNTGIFFPNTTYDVSPLEKPQEY